MLEEARKAVRGASRISVLTGAGVSAESGIPTFRSNGGFWQNRRFEDLATPQGFARDPKFVWQWYEERRRGILQRYPLEEAKKLLKPDGWNEFVITAKGSHVSIDLNGTQIIERDDPKFEKEGIIALQIHVWKEPMEVRFKDIEIKELKP